MDLWGCELAVLGGLFYVGEDLVYGPVIAGVEVEDFAVGADEGGGKSVRDGLVRLGGEADVEEEGHFVEHVFGGDGEVPVGEGFLGIAADVLRSVGAEALGCVVLRVEGDAEEVGFAGEVWISRDALVERGEVARDAGAEVGERAASVDEGDEKLLAAELAEADEVAVLVAELEVGDLVAGGGDVVDAGGFVIGAGLRNDDNVVEEDGGVVVL